MFHLNGHWTANNSSLVRIRQKVPFPVLIGKRNCGTFVFS
jgi:hypothetical protein